MVEYSSRKESIRQKLEKEVQDRNLRISNLNTLSKLFISYIYRVSFQV